MNELFSRFLELSPRNRLAVSLVSCGLIFFVGGLIWSISPFSQPQNASLETAPQVLSATSSAPLKVKMLVVDIEGAVQKPGVYSVKTDARVQDVLNAAGGLSEKADKTWVQKGLNLASKLTDGQKIYIPSQGEVSTTNYAQPAIADGVQSGVNGFININTASSSDLDSLSGIGAVTAQKIIDNRPYSSIEDLKTKKIVGTKVFDQIKDKITVN